MDTHDCSLEVHIKTLNSAKKRMLFLKSASHSRSLSRLYRKFKILVCIEVMNRSSVALALVEGLSWDRLRGILYGRVGGVLCNGFS